MLVGVMSFSFCSTAFAAEQVSNSMFYTKDVETSAIELSKAEMAEYNIYNLSLPSDLKTKGVSDEEITKDSILRYCTEVSIDNIDGYEITTYESDVLANYLYNCESIIDIAEMNGSLYVTYLTSDNENVVLNYNEEGLLDKCVYENETGKSIYISDEEALVDNAVLYEMSDELQDFINEQIDKGEIDQLYEIDNLHISEEDGAYVIEEKAISEEVTPIGAISLMSTSVPTSDSELLNNLKKDFSMYTGQVKFAGNKNCAYLGKNVRVTIKEDRNSYTKSKGNWKTFGAGVAVTLVAAYLGGPMILAVKVLTAAGIGISAADTLLSAIQLSKSAEYTFKGNRFGYAYDTTVWNKDVLVQVKKSGGKFSGGYNSSGKFTWIISTSPSAYDKSIDQWVNNVITYYNSDLVSKKGKTSFMP